MGVIRRHTWRDGGLRLPPSLFELRRTGRATADKSPPTRPPRCSSNARGELRDRITVFRKVSPRSTILYHSFYYEWPQARSPRDAREAAELLEQARARPSGRYARLLWPFGTFKAAMQHTVQRTVVISSRALVGGLHHRYAPCLSCR